MLTILASIAVCRFDPQSGQTKDFYIGICCFSAKHIALMSKSKDWLAWSWQGNNCWSRVACLPYKSLPLVIPSLEYVCSARDPYNTYIDEHVQIPIIHT